MQQARLAADDGAVGDWFGRAVALSGDTALVGSWYAHDDFGAAYIFTRIGRHWTQQARLTARDGAAQDFFGTSVALDGRTGVVGAAGVNSNAGAAYIFVQGGREWTQQATLNAGGRKPGDTFGTSVALSGGTALIGAGFAQHDAGAAYVFTRLGSHCMQQARLAAYDGAAGDWFGRAVALSGDTALVGAWYANDDFGAAYAFARRGSNWVQQARLTARDEVAQDYFGTSVALSGATGLVGAGFRNQGTGAAYVFRIQPAISW